MSTLTLPGRASASVGEPTASFTALPMPARLAARIAHALSVRRAAHALARMDDRMLRDIGLERCGIGYAASVGRDLAGE